MCRIVVGIGFLLDIVVEWCFTGGVCMCEVGVICVVICENEENFA